VKTRREEEKEKRRSLIITGARKCFFLYGLKGATMEGIARECRLAKGTLYLYFSSKEELFVSLAEEALGLLNRSIERSLEGARGDVERQFREIALMYYRFSRSNREYFKILMMIDYDLLSARIAPEKLNRIDARIEGILKEGIQQGIFPDETDISMAVRSSWAMLQGGIFLAEKGCQKMPMLTDMDDEAFIGQLTMIMFRSLKTGIINKKESHEIR
jgi:AcrR family transcriptional regulator